MGWKIIFDAQKYELDEKQVYDFYKIVPKQEPIYNVINNETLVSIVIINFYDYLIYDFPLGCASPSKWEL
jgi:hypothetical protein